MLNSELRTNQSVVKTLELGGLLRATAAQGECLQSRSACRMACEAM
jgi:hypothetical protein